MPDGLVLPAVREYLDSRQVKSPSTEKTMQLLDIVRNNNFMEFGEKIFQQVGGTSIGKKHAPPLACLGAGKLENDTIFPSDEYKSLVLDDKDDSCEKNRFYKRFIDDIIAAMKGTKEDAQRFVDWMNTLWPELEFTFEWSDKELTYLDVNLIMTEGKLETDRFIKPTNPQLYLHFKSNHPPQVFKAIVFGQAITVKTICSKEEFVVKHFENLKQKFMERGYPVELIRENLARGAQLDREDLLKPKFYPTQATPVLASKPKFIPTFIITYNPHNPPLNRWLKETFLILQADPKMKEIYKKPPSVTFRQPRSLKQILVRNRLRELPFQDCSDVLGCYRHDHGRRGRGCLLCPKIEVSKQFRSSFTGLTYSIRHQLNCKSCYVVYLVTCNACSAQYVGKTTEAMHKRHTGQNGK